MLQRIAALREHGVTITQIQKELAALELMDGAEDFIRQLSSRVKVVIVSDLFRPMNQALLGRIEASRIFCHSFTVDEAGLISGFNLWNDLRGKHEVLGNVPCDPARCLALGDALNDLGLLRAVGCGVLFRPSAATRDQAKDLIWSSTYAEVSALFAAHIDGFKAASAHAVEA
jgi:bifunctional phosphoserine phosphatase/homoserine phosphotransferase